MSASRLIIRPFLGATSRLLLDQTANAIAPASSGQLATAIRPLAPRLSSICLSCRFANGPQLRFSSTNSNPQDPSKRPKPLSSKESFPDEAFLASLDPSASSSSPAPPVAPQAPESAPSPESSSSPSSSRPVNPSPSSQSESKSESDPTPQPSSASPNPLGSRDASLPSQKESRQSELGARFAEFMDRAQSKLFVASQRINDLTGYSGIETLKEQVAGLETALAAAQETLHTARAAYKTKVADRASTQREVTTLLARQKTWTPLDFERFTTLYRTDYELEAEVAERARDLEEAERDAERLGRELSTAILARYHEEQIWSDKIRRMSTWGTWGLMTVNVLLFLVFQFGAEPWRRARLVRGFEDKVREALDADRAQEQATRDKAWREFMDLVAAKVPLAAIPAPAAQGVDAAVDPKVEAPEKVPEPPMVFPPPLPPSSWSDALVDPAWWREAAAYLVSEQQVAIRMRDVSLAALQGLTAGAVLAGTIAVLCLRGA